jgi:sugar diacid utilization regulator
VSESALDRLFLGVAQPMATDPPSSTVAAVLHELGPGAQIVAGERHVGRRVRGASIWSRADVPVAADDLVLICPDVDFAEFLDRLHALPAAPERFIVLSSPLLDGRQTLLLRDHVVVQMSPAVDPADIVLAVARAVEPPEEVASRRLSAVQRRLTQALADPEPVSALLSRLKAVCNATVAVIDRDGRVVRATGPFPLALLYGQLTRTVAESQMLDAEGWRGVADRIADPAVVDGHFGWLVAISQRTAFPDVLVVSAVHVAATLVEASRRMTQVAQEQERAIRAAVLEEALALQAHPQDPELTGRISSLGLSFDEELRTFVCRSPSGRQDRATRDDLARRLPPVLAADGITHLLTVRSDTVIVLAQCSDATLRRTLVARGRSLPRMYVGVGRRVRRLGNIADSHRDALLGVQSLARRRGTSGFVRYEDFDVATRLFADVGVDRVTEWAREFLAPLQGREALYEGLRTYFESDQNMNAAADALNIHHNSLRYRLSKVEALLNIRLREPAAVSSVFLALTAVSMGELQEYASLRRPQPDSSRPVEVDAPHSPLQEDRFDIGNLDAALAPER